MAIGIAVIASLVALRRRNGQSRLKTLQQKLLRKNPNQTTLYQYPIKKIVAILFIIALAFFLQWHAKEYDHQLRQKIILLKMRQFEGKKASDQFLWTISEQCPQNSFIITEHQHLAQNLNRLRTTLTILYLIFGISIIFLLLSLDLRIVRVCKQQQKTIKTITYRTLGLSAQKQQYLVQDGSKLVIWQRGESRLTNTNYYYEVRLRNKQQSFGIIQRACIYDARTAVIELSYHLSIPFSTKIIKEPLSQL